MYNNPYVQYYNEQVQTGGGISGAFSGVRVQRGRGFLGNLGRSLWSFGKDLFSKAGKRALTSVADLAQDVIKGENVAQSAKRRALEAGKNIADITLDELKTKLQGGSGIRMRGVQNFRKIKRKRYIKRKSSKKKINKRKDKLKRKY